MFNTINFSIESQNCIGTEISSVVDFLLGLTSPIIKKPAFSIVSRKYWGTVTANVKEEPVLT